MSKLIKLPRIWDNFDDLWGFRILATNSSPLISWKISKSLRFFCIRLSVRSRRAPWDLCKSSKLENTEFMPKTVKITQSRGLWMIFRGFHVLATNSSPLISWKISKSLRFFCIGLSVRSRRAPWDLCKSSKLENTKFMPKTVKNTQSRGLWMNFRGFHVLAKNSSFVISWKFSRSLRFSG